MIDRLLGNRLALAGALVLSALLGAALYAGIAALLPGMGKRGEVERVVHTYLLEHPEVVLESVDRYRQRETAKAEKAQADAEVAANAALPAELPRLRTPFGSAWTGNPQGDVTVVAFMDYACGYCRASLAGIDQLLKRDPGVRIVYREYPVLGPESVTAARWALAAAEQGKFKPFHDALFAADGPSDANIAAAAKTAGLDMAAAQKAVASPAVETEIKANHGFGQKLAMAGTPAWVIGGKLYYGARDYDGLAEAVAAARGK